MLSTALVVLIASASPPATTLGVDGFQPPLIGKATVSQAVNDSLRAAFIKDLEKAGAGTVLDLVPLKEAALATKDKAERKRLQDQMRVPYVATGEVTLDKTWSFTVRVIDMSPGSNRLLLESTREFKTEAELRAGLAEVAVRVTEALSRAQASRAKAP